MISGLRKVMCSTMLTLFLFTGCECDGTKPDQKTVLDRQLTVIRKALPVGTEEVFPTDRPHWWKTWIGGKTYLVEVLVLEATRESDRFTRVASGYPRNFIEVKE